MEYLLQICYIVKSNNTSIASQKEMERYDKLSNEIDSLLPEECNRYGIEAKKQSLSLIKLEEGKNCNKCELCGDYIAMPNSNALSSVAEGKIIKGKNVCKNCAWEIIDFYHQRDTNYDG